MEIIAEELKKDYFRQGNGTNHFLAVDSVSLSLKPGTLTMLSGRSGSGKTTFLQLLSGLLMPSSGTVTADSRNLYEMKDAELSAFRNRHFSVIPQGQSLLASLTVRQNILLQAEMYGKNEEAEKRAELLMERLGIRHLSEEMPAALSGGELRRAAIVRALAGNPDAVFADEPTGDLDDENTVKVLELLRETADNGALVFLVTHETGIERFADRILRMDAGKIIE